MVLPIPPGHVSVTRRQLCGQLAEHDLFLESLQDWTRFNAQLISEHKTGVLIGPQSLDLAASSVESDHELAPVPTPGRRYA